MTKIEAIAFDLAALTNSRCIGVDKDTKVCPNRIAAEDHPCSQICRITSSFRMRSIKSF